MKILVALPAFNEEKVITKVIEDLASSGIKNVLVIDDGSSDQTGRLAKEAGATVLRHFKNSGLGVSLRTALRFAKQNSYDILITMDSDGQHLASDVKLFIDEIKKGKDVVIGGREFKNAKVSSLRKLILKLSDIYTFLLFGVATHDSQSGFRGFSKSAIQNFHLTSERMEVSSEIFAEIRRNKLKYGEVPIRAIYTSYSLKKGQKNSNMFRVAWKLFLNLLK